MNENYERSNDNKGLLFSLVGVLTLVVAIAGATYAYFQATANNADTVRGTAASGGLSMTVTKVGGGDGMLVPQLGSAINAAAVGTNQGTAQTPTSCKDGNGNTICQIYSITITNGSTAAVKVSGTISFGGITNMPNLKYTTSTAQTSGYSTTGTEASTQATTLGAAGTNLSLAATGTTGASTTFYLIVWIEEKNSVQNDSGTFTATVTFNSSDGKGITSTITS